MISTVISRIIEIQLFSHIGNIKKKEINHYCIECYAGELKITTYIRSNLILYNLFRLNYSIQ
jgi:hypothetical protein